MISIEAKRILQLMSLKGVGTLFINKLINNMKHSNDIAELLSRDINYLSEKLIITKTQLKQIEDKTPKIENEIQRLEKINAGIITVFDNKYPKLLFNSLGMKSPPMLAYLGNLSLLDKKAVGFCGSRKASDIGIEVANDIATQLSKNDVVVVSGHASGIDQTTHYAALISGGNTIIVLPEGLLHFKIRKVLKDVWDWKRVLVLSEFLPEAVWTTSRAMQRNNTIIGLSYAMILIEAKKSGGSMEAGKKTIGMKKRLFVPTYEGLPDFAEGNRILLKNGAVEIKKSKTTGKANLNTLLNNIDINGNTHHSIQQKFSF